MVALRAACGMPAGARRLVVTPSYTFTATACAIEWAGFEPVFVDIERRGWHLDPAALEAALERFAGRGGRRARVRHLRHRARRRAARRLARAAATPTACRC